MATLLLFFGALALAQVPDEPIITAAPESTEVALFPADPSATGEPCKKVVCYDYINTCSIRYGGCYPACAGNARPTYSGALCEGGIFSSSIAPPSATQPDPCGYKCEYSTDTCGNTVGPGCYTSCPGIEPPGYTVPRCEAIVTPAQTIYVTPVPAANTVELFVPLDVLEKRQEDAAGSATASVESTIEAATTSEMSMEFTPEPIPEGGATIGADLSTIEPQSTETSAATSTESSTSDIATSSAVEAESASSTASSLMSSTEAETAPMSTDVASSTDASASDVPATQSDGMESSSTITARASEAETASPTVTDSSGGDDSTSVSSAAPVTLWTPEPISEGGATIGANLATIRPTVYGYLPVADIMDSPEDIAANQAPAPTPDADPVTAEEAPADASTEVSSTLAEETPIATSSEVSSTPIEETPAAASTEASSTSTGETSAAASTEVSSTSAASETPTTSIDGEQLNSAIFAVDFVSSSETASEATATDSVSTPTVTGIAAAEQTPPADDGEPSK